MATGISAQSVATEFLEILELAEIEGIKIGSPEVMFDIKSAPKDTNTKLPRN